MESSEPALNGGSARAVCARDAGEQPLPDDDAQRARSMEAAARLTGRIAHDFNDILTIVLSKADLLAEALPPEAAQMHADLLELRRAARRGADATDRMLSFARRRSLTPALLDLTRLVEGMVGTLRRLLPDSVELVVRPAAEDGLLVRADAAAVQQVLLDLATNARDAMPRGGTLTIDVEPVPSKLGADVVRLTVSDTGDGIAPDLSELVFEPFFTTKRADRAAGLGLSSVYGVVRQHGGRVTLGAASGGGTAVRVELPGVSRPREHGEGDRTPHPASPRRGGWILVVEDEEGIRRSVQRALERHGWAVQEAADGLEALSLLEEYGAAFDLLIVDVLLPGLDGIALHGAARSLGLEVPFLFTSGYRDREILLTLGSDPRCAFLPKPWSAPELLARVREVLREVGWEGGSRSG